MHLRPRRKLAAQLKTVCRPVTMRVFYHTLVTKRPNYLELKRKKARKTFEETWNNPKKSWDAKGEAITNLIDTLIKIERET